MLTNSVCATQILTHPHHQTITLKHGYRKLEFVLHLRNSSDIDPGKLQLTIYLVA